MIIPLRNGPENTYGLKVGDKVRINRCDHPHHNRIGEVTKLGIGFLLVDVLDPRTKIPGDRDLCFFDEVRRLAYLEQIAEAAE